MMPTRVLVVDDEESILSALSDYLELRGYEVDRARSREEAEVCLARGSHAALIADLRLAPSLERSGLEVVVTARRSNPGIRTLLLTAYRSPEVEEQARQAGVDQVLVKPLPLTEVAGALGELLADR
jgi:two-component system alkaline phosphatase synthesis response regulator PhoP